MDVAFWGNKYIFGRNSLLVKKNRGRPRVLKEESLRKIGHRSRVKVITRTFFSEMLVQVPEW